MSAHTICYGVLGHLEKRMLSKEEILAESVHYILYHDCESVCLSIKNNEIPSIGVGSHYGNPKAGIISKNEDYTVSVGCGICLAFIRNIFNDGYRYHCEYEEFLNTPDNLWSVVRVFQVNEDANEYFRFHCANEDYDLAEYSMNIISKKIQLIKVLQYLPGANDR